MFALNHNISTIEYKQKEYKCVIPNEIYDMFKVNKTNVKFLCMLILNKKCKFFDRNNVNKLVSIDDYYHVLEIPVNKFEKMDISVYTLFVDGFECFTFQVSKEV